jgi:hypothetical protein
MTVTSQLLNNTTRGQLCDFPVFPPWAKKSGIEEDNHPSSTIPYQPSKFEDPRYYEDRLVANAYKHAPHHNSRIMPPCCVYEYSGVTLLLCLYSTVFGASLLYRTFVAWYKYGTGMLTNAYC